MGKWSRKTVELIAILLFLFGISCRCFASLIYVPNTYGLSSRGMALVNTLAADDQDLSACYYNPAALASGNMHGVGFSYIYTAPDMTGGLVGGETVRQNESNQMVLVNLRTDLRKLFAKRLNVPPIGFGLNVGVDDNFTTMMVFDDMRTYKGTFDRYGMSNLTLQGALGFGITDWASIGFGIHGGFSGHGEVVTRADVTGPTSNEGTSMRGALRPSPMAGLYFHGDNWATGVVYREETFGSFDTIEVRATPTIAGLELPQLEIPMTFFDTYVPRQLNIGASYSPTKNVRLMAEGNWSNWGQYDEVAGQSKYVGSTSDYNTVDVWAPRFAIEATPLEDLYLRGGYSYETTPFRTIGTRFPGGGDSIKGKVILDNDLHKLGLGAGYLFNERKILAIDLELDFAYQLHAFTPRKADTSDGYTYQSEGFLHLFSGSLELHF